MVGAGDHQIDSFFRPLLYSDAYKNHGAGGLALGMVGREVGGDESWKPHSHFMRKVLAIITPIIEMSN